MNEFILNKLHSAETDLSDITLETTEYLIPKRVLITPESMAIGKKYIIEVADYIIHPSSTFDLHVNWNNNIIPKDACMKCTVLTISGKMLKVAGNGYDKLSKEINSNKWVGWLPQKSIISIREVN